MAAVGDIISRSCEQMVNGRLCTGELRVSAPTPGFSRLPDEMDPADEMTLLGVTCSACGAFYYYDEESDRLSRLS
jgi:hypothetical protein